MHFTALKCRHSDIAQLNKRFSHRTTPHGTREEVHRGQEPSAGGLGPPDLDSLLFSISGMQNSHTPAQGLRTIANFCLVFHED